jgi:hypothetical protein
MSREEKLIGMLPGAAPHCRPRPGGTSPALRWSVITAKLVGSGEVGMVAPRQNFWWKNVVMDFKTSFFGAMSEVQKDLQDISAVIGQFKKIWHKWILSGIWRQS